MSISSRGWVEGGSPHRGSSQVRRILGTFTVMSTAAHNARRYPRWFGTLYVTDTLERFGFYGMQAILVLYAAAPVSEGGLGLGKADAASLFGAWIALMF